MNLAQIRAMVLGDLDRTDATNAQADAWINSSISRISRKVRLPNSDTGELLSSTDGYVNIPLNLVENRAIYYNDTQLIQPAFPVFLAYPATCDPKYFFRFGDRWLIKGTPSADTFIGVLYYQSPDTLEDDDDTGLIPGVAPDAVKYGALVEAATFFKDDRKTEWAQEFVNRVQELDDYSKSFEMRESPLAMPNYFAGMDY